MRKLLTLVFVIAALILASPAWSGPKCQYALTVDRCDKRVLILPTGEEADVYEVALDEGPAAAYEPGGVALATVPGAENFAAFVPQGPYLHLIGYWAYDEDEDGTRWPISPRRTLSLVDDLGWGPVELTGVAAGEALTINGETVYPLYVVGNVPGTPPHPYVMILDQEALIDGDFDLMSVLWGAGYLDYADDSGGTAIDVSVGATLDGGHKQVAYASVLRGAGLLVQQFHTITFEDGAGFYTYLEPWNDEGVIYSGSEPEALGLDHESLGLGAYGVFQTSSVVSDPETGTLSCDLAGDLTDVAVWGPDAELDHAYVQFVTASDGTGPGTLLGYPEEVCPYTVPPLATPGAMVQPVGSRPLALALSSRTSSPLWVYTANGSGGVTAVNVRIFSDAVDGDTVEYLRQFDIELGGCPSAIVFRDEAYEECMENINYGDPPGPRPDDFCDENPFDPWCLTQLGEKPGHS